MTRQHISLRVDMISSPFGESKVKILLTGFSKINLRARRKGPEFGEKINLANPPVESQRNDCTPHELQF